MFARSITLALAAATTLSTLPALALTTSPLQPNPANAINAPLRLAQAEVYQVRMWYDITGSNDGIGDNTLELYGETRIGGRVIGFIPRGAADGHKREAGSTIDFGQTTVSGGQMTVSATLMDADGGSSDDRVFNMSPRVLNLVRGRTYTFKQRYRGGEGANLNIRID
jgi:hypothetical protein